MNFFCSLPLIKKEGGNRKYGRHYKKVETLLKKIVVLPNGIEVLITTPHSVNFYWEGDLSGNNLFIANGSGYLVNARSIEEEIGEIGPAKLITTKFVEDSETERILKELKRIKPNLVIIGSIIAAQAFPGLIYGLVPEKGFERVTPELKRMSIDRFNIYLK